MTSDLVMPLNAVSFDAIKRGDQVEEFRQITPHWSKLLERRTYDRLVLWRGYPRTSDSNRILVLPWLGVTRKTIARPFFGPKPLEVYAIDVSGAAL